MIPFNPLGGGVKPYKEIINEVQEMRSPLGPKGSLLNMLYKEIGNSIYGNISRAISEKKKYDNQSDLLLPIKAHKLSNPIIASWITAYIRSIIGARRAMILITLVVKLLV